MASISAVIDRWLDTLEGRTGGNGRRLENLNGAKVYGAGTVLYSYGRHFPLAEYYPRDRRRRRPLFLLNGDRVSNSTSRHQRETRDCISRAAGRFNAETLIVPFSALEAAGILRDTLIPLEIRDDRNLLEYETVPPEINLDDIATAGAVSEVSEWNYRGRKYQVWDNAGRVFERTLVTARREGYGANEVWRDGLEEWTRGRLISREGRTLASLERTDNGIWRAVYSRHLLGDSLFTAAVRESRTVRRPVTVLDVVRAAVATVQNQSAARSRDRRDRIRLTRLGDTLEGRSGLELLRDPLALLDVTAPIVETVPVLRRRRFVSSFDANEPAPLYFLATLPAVSRAVTVDAAVMDLAPRAVHAALARGREVLRQGDIFAIATDLSDTDIAALTRSRARLTQWTRDAKPREGEVGYESPMRAADMRRLAALRRREYRRLRAAYRPPAPHGGTRGSRRRWRKLAAERAASLERYRREGRAAILRNGPNDVLPAARAEYAYRRPTALETARDRYRQTLAHGGTDCHNYRGRAHARDHYRAAHVGGPPALALWHEAGRLALERMRPLEAGRRYGSDGRAWTAYRDRLRAALTVYGTAHSATEVVQARGGAVYVRGTMRHAVSLEAGRFAADHIPLPLGDGTRWYLAVRNTVPRSRAAR